MRRGAAIVTRATLHPGAARRSRSATILCSSTSFSMRSACAAEQWITLSRWRRPLCHQGWSPRGCTPLLPPRQKTLLAPSSQSAGARLRLPSELLHRCAQAVHHPAGRQVGRRRAVGSAVRHDSGDRRDQLAQGGHQIPKERAVHRRGRELQFTGLPQGARRRFGSPPLLLGTRLGGRPCEVPSGRL
jgi:hypothetical protein